LAIWKSTFWCLAILKPTFVKFGNLSLDILPSRQQSSVFERPVFKFNDPDSESLHLKTKTHFVPGPEVVVYANALIHCKIQLDWGRCCAHYFLRFSTIFGEKIGAFLSNRCLIKFLHYLPSFVFSHKSDIFCLLMPKIFEKS
jgi:hypothetical protein